MATKRNNNVEVTASGSAIMTASVDKQEKKPVSKMITERFIDELKQGRIPWEKPWVCVSSSGRCGGWSHDKRRDGKPYSLLNQMLLPKEGEYLTWNEIQNEGGKVKKGAKSCPIFYYKSIDVEQENPKTHRMENVKVPMLKYYRVFHIDDTEGIEPNFKVDTSAIDNLKEPEKCRRAEEIMKSYLDRSGVTLTHKAQDQAYYSPSTDSITLPLKKQFKDKAGYYSTAFHEMTHSTGHEDRLNRFKSDSVTSNIGYSLEELVAEIGAATMLKTLRLETDSSHRNNSAYIQSWLRSLGDNPQMVVKASSRASKAVDLIYGVEPKTYEENKDR